MTARKKILVSLAPLTVLGGVLWELWCSRIPDPIYEGKPLSYWLSTYKTASSIPPSTVKADLAVRHAGTNAIPLLLRFLSAHDSVFKLKMMNWAAKQHFIRFPFDYARNRRFQAECGFQALGSDGSNAVPELIRIHEMTSSQDGRYIIIETFGWIGSGAEQAVPLVFQAATNSDTILRSLAIRTLGQMRVQPVKSVPVLTGALKDPSPWLSPLAVKGLGNFGPQAKEAVPDLIKLRSKTHAWEMEHASQWWTGPPPATTSDIDEALQKIDPAAAANAGIQTNNASPAQ
jgi:HEAT repeat protein